ncbi:hypothetical protein [Aquimarina sediminis]|uniref:hypothetical protein n=1 Tax=Aquimarina sediminis TaxID=2070536 RepID=UPI000CA02D20|nr:hypothetical protein [Aquimarina sediminis]
MIRVKYIESIVLIFCLLSCDTKGTEIITPSDSLASLIAANSVEIDNVIACASATKESDDKVTTYVYPRTGATDIRYYETSSIEDDKDDYQNYTRVPIESTDFFNGYLKKFTQKTTHEKWVIITFFEDDKLHLSNPIRLKHRTKPTEFVNTVMIDLSEEQMPVFIWDDGVFKENKIYFEVISDERNELLSGTYTFEKRFQYYKLDNVVLNITEQTPPQLNPKDSYNFTLMGVSEDNWVNLFIEKSFEP